MSKHISASLHHFRARLALRPLAAPDLAARTTASRPCSAAAFLAGRRLSILRSSGQYAYGSTLLAPLVSPPALPLLLNLCGACTRR